MERSRQQPVKSMPKTPKSGGKEKDKKEKAKEGEDNDKEKEQARAETKKQQDHDMPRFASGENEIHTAKDSYEILTELGRGSFGAVYGVIRKSDQQSFALKCESVHCKKAMLPHEANCLIALNLLKSPHFVEMVDQGDVAGRFLFVVMKCVGRNLWDIRVELPERKYTLKTVLIIAAQTLAGLRDLHRVGYLHRDIKPPNFAVGRDASDGHTIYLLDFGLCRRIAKKGQDLRMPRAMCAFRGTTRYASMAAHENKDQSRKDDIESWWYMIAEMIIIEIPWKQKKGTDRDAIRDDKKRLRTNEDYFKFLFRKCCYEQMSNILKYLDTLTYTSIPDYDFVHRQVQAMAVVNKINPTDPPDWDATAKAYKGPVYKENQPYIVKQLE